MTEPLPKFQNPPVTETALSVQFSPVRGYTAAHGGQFWRDVLGSDWVTATEAPRLPEIHERFGQNQMAGNALIGAINVNVGLGGSPSPRLQFRDTSSERMIQIQNTRFAYNWSRGANRYPSFDRILPEFEKYFARYNEFCRNLQSSELQLDQWEITYVNNFVKGEMWQTVGDWTKLIPSFVFPGVAVENQVPTSAQIEWQLTIGENKGRLHVSMLHARLGSPTGPDALVLQLVARGPIGQDANLRSGFECGHEAIVRTFASMTSKAAHEKWKRIV